MKNHKKIAKVVASLNSLVKDRENGTKFMFQRDTDNKDGLPFPLKRRYLIKDFFVVRSIGTVVEERLNNDGRFETVGRKEKTERIGLLTNGWRMWGPCGMFKMSEYNCLGFDLNGVVDIEIDEKSKAVYIKREEDGKKFVSLLQVM